MLIAAALFLMIACCALAVAAVCGRMDRPPRPAKTGTMDDPRVAWMVTKQQAYGRWLRKKGRTVLADRPYESELHMGNVVPIRGRR